MNRMIARGVMALSCLCLAWSPVLAEHHEEDEGMEGRGPKMGQLPPEVKEDLKELRDLMKQIFEAEHELRMSEGEPDEELIDARDDMVQDLVGGVVELLEGIEEVNADNAPQIIRLLAPSFGPHRGHRGHDMGHDGGGCHGGCDGGDGCHGGGCDGGGCGGGCDE